MNGKRRIQTVLNHLNADKIAVDFGATTVTGIHCKIIEELREYYGLDKHPIQVFEPYQMLGVIEEDLAQILDIDTIGVFGPENMFGVKQIDWQPVKMPWGQEVLLPKDFKIQEKNGSVYAFPQGDLSQSPSGVMPEFGYFFNAIERQEGEIEDEKLRVEDNLEEFCLISDEDLTYWKDKIAEASHTEKAVVASFGGMGLGDVAMVPAINLKHPKGIRNITEWYMSTVIRTNYIKELFERQTDIALQNLNKLHKVVGEMVDVVYICGTDFGTQNGQFCSVETFRDLYLPYYRKMNDWIHKNTTWKTFKHTCGAVLPLIESLIDSGFDILNPVQISATGMNPQYLKKCFGQNIVFWGGGIDTQKVLPFGTEDDIRRQIFDLCEIFGQGGGFVFSSVHNIQANVPLKNVVTMMETIKEIRKR